MKSTDELLVDGMKICRSFANILEQDRKIDSDYEKNKQDNVAAYSARISQLETVRKNKIDAAVAHDQAARKQLDAVMAALANLEAQLPDRFVKRYRKTVAASYLPVAPDFQAQNILLSKIKDESFNARCNRIIRYDGFYSQSEMVNDFLNAIEAGRTYLNEEIGKSRSWLAQIRSSADYEYASGKTEADKKRTQSMNQNEAMYHQQAKQLQQRLDNLIADPSLLQYERETSTALDRLGGYDEHWIDYVPATTYPQEIMLGAIVLPMPLPQPLREQVQQKLPMTYHEENLLVPCAAPMAGPLQLAVAYHPSCKHEVMSGVQSILFKILRGMPPFSYTITYIDPNERGSNMGRLQTLAGGMSVELCRKVYASKEDILARMKELEADVDQTCATLAGIASLQQYNQTHENRLMQHFIVVNDFPCGFERNAIESLNILIKNSHKCGLSIIFTTTDNHAYLPNEVQLYPLISVNTNASTINKYGVVFDFKFDSLPADQDRYIDQIKAIYLEGLKIDNSFASFFNLSKPPCYRDSRQALMIPFAVDSRKQLVELELGSPLTAHALLSGTTGSGKSTTLHMLITSIVMHYHPDDVTLWLVDYKKVEFAEYLYNMPPHIKLLGLERNAEFTFSLLDMIDNEFQRRMVLFKQAGVNTIAEYKEKFGAHSLARIILIVDEFHNMTQAIQSEPHYVRILENILSEYRVFGLSCVFSDQAISDGLRGLTEKGRKQIRTRIAMANDLTEVRETLALDSSFYDENLRRKISRMNKGDVIFKRVFETASGEVQDIVDRYRTVLVTRDERVAVAKAALAQSGQYTNRSEPLIVDGQGRSKADLQKINTFAEKAGLTTGSQIPIFIGTPANLQPCFYFMLKEKPDANIMVIGAQEDLRASVVYHVLLSFRRQRKQRILILADPQDELFRLCQNKLEQLDDNWCSILTNLDEICSQISLIAADLKNNSDNQLIVWFGLEELADDFSRLPEKNPQAGRNVTTALKTDSGQAEQAVDQLLQEIDDLLASYQDQDASKAEAVTGTQANSEPIDPSYDARQDIQDIIGRGPRYGVFTLVTFSSVKMLKQTRFIKSENFEHKIAFSMSLEDSSQYLGKGTYAAGLDDITAVYNDGGTGVRTFRPYLLP